MTNVTKEITENEDFLRNHFQLIKSLGLNIENRLEELRPRRTQLQINIQSYEEYLCLAELQRFQNL